VPLQEARLSTFLAADKSNTADTEADNVFLSGQVIDQQSLLNVTNLVSTGSVNTTSLQAFTRLFELLGLPPSELSRLAENLRFASDISTDNQSASQAPLLPQTVEQLSWLGLSPRTVALLQPHVTVLPQRTRVNLNTASAEVIYAAMPGISLADAQRLVAERDRSPFRNPADATKLLAGTASQGGGEVGIDSRFFEVRGRLRLGSTLVEERSLVFRDGIEVKTLLRERGVVHPTAAGQATGGTR
jgi:general secretion pathway protein K